MKIAVKRLEAVVKHLREGKPIHQNFDFSTYHSDVWIFESERKDAVKEGYCGYAGCAVGENPAVFPDKWEIRAGPFGSSPFLKKKSTGCSLRDAAKFFRLNKEQAKHLFIPRNQLPRRYGNKGMILGRDAGKGDVADNIERFVAWAKKNKK